MIDFLNGIAMAASFGVGLFFLRMWRESRDRFFALFGLAFWILALNWLVLAWVSPAAEHRHYVYAIRLVAFLLILAAIVDKNRAVRTSEGRAERRR
jgi:peptidoglycan/LPS O-acetylase OafA/YrhL